VESIVVVAVLAAAVLHAGWNALAKSSRDPLLNMATVTASGGLAAAAVVPFVPFPGAAAWPYLLAAVLLHFLYQLSLVRCYALGDLSQVYPIARGLAPLGVALLALFAGEVPNALQVAGLIVACGGIVSLAGVHRTRRAPGAAIASAVLTAILISGYTVVDGLGVRAVDTAASYIAWSFFLDAFPIVLFARHQRAGELQRFLRSEGRRGVVGGVMATLCYSIVLWALAHGPMAAIAALRETSVIFAALLGTCLLGEPFGRRRLAAACALAAGLALMHA
jgi:drug/metabolite transporter (DMT)-like permease